MEKLLAPWKAFYNTVEALPDCNDLHRVMETSRQVERPTISCYERMKKLSESYSNMLFHHKEGKQMVSFVVFIF